MCELLVWILGALLTCLSGCLALCFYTTKGGNDELNQLQSRNQLLEEVVELTRALDINKLSQAERKKLNEIMSQLKKPDVLVCV